MVHRAIAVYVGEQLTCLPPYQFNERVYIIFIVCVHFNALTLNILYVSFTFLCLVCRKIAQMS